MSPSNAEIVWVEDDEFAIEIGIEVMEREGHSVVEVIGSLGELEEYVQMSKSEGKLFLVDGNLGLENRNFDGSRTVEIIRESKHTTESIIIGRPLGGKIAGVDVMATKKKVSIFDLSAVIDKL